MLPTSPKILRFQILSSKIKKMANEKYKDDIDLTEKKKVGQTDY